MTDYFLDLPPSQSLAMPAEVEDKDVESGEKVTFLDRVSHFTLNWWLVTMGTGSIAVLLGQQPHTFKGLQTIGKVVFIWDLFLFIIICLLTAIRFYRQPSLFVRAFRNPAEALFSAAFLISINNIIICMQEYGVSSTGPWMIVTLRIVFWIYVAISFILGVSVYLELFTARQMTTQDILPAWLLPILPIMLSGSIAASIASMQPTYYRQSILVAGVTFQGLGFWLAISLYGPIFIRLMKIGLPAPALRPGIFVAVAAPAYTSFSLINMSLAIPTNTTYFEVHPTAVDTLETIALLFGIFLWALAFWWFCVSLISTLTTIGKCTFHLIWYSVVFPTTGFILATISIGKGLYSNAILWVASVMTILLVATYIFIIVMHARAIYRRDILWPGKDEDKET